MLYVLQAQLADRPIISSYDDLRLYLRGSCAAEKAEQVRVLHLNTKNILIADEVTSLGTIDRSAIYIREIIGRALDIGSTAIILVHNHPSGDTTPSSSDVETTRRIEAAGRPFGIFVHDHLIVAGGGCISLRAQGIF
jgi:DNA repair protein RadC